MHAAVLREYKKPFSYEEVPVPEVGDDDVLVQVKAAGYCHTDLQVNEGVYESAGAKPGMIGSHEPAGLVVKLVSEKISVVHSNTDLLQSPLTPSTQCRARTPRSEAC